MPHLLTRPLRTLLGIAIAIAIAATLQATAPGSAHAATTPWLKPVLGGLLDRQKEPTTGFRGTVDAYVIEIAWADLQSTADGPITTNNAIDQAIANARAKGLE